MKLVNPSFEILASTAGEDFRYSYLDPNRLIEAAGRTCYKSESKITSESAAPFVEQIRKRGHLSVLEHSWGIIRLWDTEALKLWQGPRSKFIEYETFFAKPKIVDMRGQKQISIALIMAGNMRAFEEFYPEMWKRRESDFKLAANNPGKFNAVTVKFVCNRGVSHELVRHRIASYSQESTRYCDYSGGVSFVIPSWIQLNEGSYDFSPDGEMIGSVAGLTSLPTTHWTKALIEAEERYIQLLNEGWSPQQARGVLPIDLKTEIIATANLNEWKHIFNLRCNKAAHPQIRELMVPLREEFRKMFPKEVI